MAWFEKAKEWMTPERALAFQGIGMGLSQLDAGQPVNLSPVYEALDQRKQQAAMRKMLDVPGIMDSFTPQQQAVIAAMPEGLATQVIMEHAFKAQEPVAGVNVGGNLVNPYTGEVMYAAPGEAPKPIEVGGVLLDPVTMQPIFDSRTPEAPAPYSDAAKINADLQAGLITPEQAQAALDGLGQADLPASVDEYNYYAQQETAAGRQPLSYNDWDLQGKRAGATTVNNTVATGDASTKTGQVFDEMKASADAARAAVTGLASLKEASAALEDGVVTGAMANSRLAARKLGLLFGIGDPAIVENTETFRSAIAPQVAAMMKATVGSTQISNADREFAEKAAGGSINLDEASIKRLLGIMERAAKVVIDLHNQKLDKVYPKGSGADRERALFEITSPGAVAPTGNTTSSGVEWSIEP